MSISVSKKCGGDLTVSKFVSATPRYYFRRGQWHSYVSRQIDVKYYHRENLKVKQGQLLIFAFI